MDGGALHPHSRLQLHGLLKRVKKRVETQKLCSLREPERSLCSYTEEICGVTCATRSLAWLGATALPVILWWGSFLCCGRYWPVPP